MKSLTPCSFVGLLLISSCSKVCYVPNMHQVPLFRERNEIRAGGAIGGSGVVNAVSLKEFQAAYSVADHIAVMVVRLFIALRSESSRRSRALNTRLKVNYAYPSFPRSQQHSFQPAFSLNHHTALSFQYCGCF
jgi:hypothetical protein